jgi:hypothetical protein
MLGKWAVLRDQGKCKQIPMWYAPGFNNKYHFDAGSGIYHSVLSEVFLFVCVEVLWRMLFQFMLGQ